MRKHYWFTWSTTQGHRNVPEWHVHTSHSWPILWKYISLVKTGIGWESINLAVEQSRETLKQLLHSSVDWALAVCQASCQISALILSDWIPEVLWYHPSMQIIIPLVMQRILHLGRTLRDLWAQCPVQQNFLLQPPWQFCNLYLNTSLPFMALSYIVVCFWPRRVVCFMISWKPEVPYAHQYQQVLCYLLF